MYELTRWRDRRACELSSPVWPAGSLGLGAESWRELKLWGTWRFENGLEAGAILRQSQGEDGLVAASRSGERSLTRFDLALVYGFGVLPAWGQEGAWLSVRLELINALDEEAVRRGAGGSVAAGGFSFERYRLEPRRLWTAVELRF